ncbi:MAG: hypothetical protein HW389_3166 [Bacteroidetes bacterium]|nr:hypothetical protein [Bacteroidota bacterium]
MTIFIDLAGSWIVRASMITVMLGLSVKMNDALYKTTQQVNANAALASNADVIYTDMNMAGYNSSSPFFATALSTDVQFYGDLNNGGIPETIRYYTSFNASTGLYKLYRTVNNENQGNPLLLGDNFKSVIFQYYDYRGILTTDRFSVMSIRIKLVAQIPGATEGFTTVTNDFTVYPANLY